jgi:PAS domain S-box-containing protein
MKRELTSEQRDQFFELTLDMLCIASGDGYFKWLNPAFTQTLGWSRYELLAHPYTYFIHPDDLAATLGEVDRQMKAGEKVFHFENRYRHKDGSWRVLSWKSTPLGELMYAVARDVTEHNRLKQNLEAANADLEQRVTERSAAVLRNERQLRLFFESAPAAIAMFDREMRYLAASRRFIEDYRVEAADLIGRRHYDIFPDVPDRWRDIHRRCLAGSVERCEEDPFPRGDGTMDWIRWEMRPWHENDGSIGGVILFSEVVTERKRAAQALEEIQELQRRVERAAKIGHWFWRATGKKADWREGISEYSDSGLAILGLEPGHPPFTNLEFIHRLVHPDDRTKVERAFDMADAAGGYALEYRVIRPNGEVRVIEERAEHLTPEDGPALSSGILQDVTEQRRAEKALQASEERYRQVVELSQELIWIHTDGIIVFANAFAAKLLGAKSPDDLVGLPFISLIHPDDRQVSRERTASVLAASDSSEW